MQNESAIAGLLADMIDYTCWGNPWHRLAEATADLAPDDLSYRPLPGIGPARRVLRHVASCAAWYGEGLAARTDDPSEAELDRLRGKRATTPADLVHVVDVACHRLHARARCVTDAQLCDRTGVWNRAYKGFVLLDGGVLHAAWYFGQVAMLCSWRRAAAGRPMAPAPGPAGIEGRAPRRDWDDLHLASRRDACLRLLRLAYEESGWHALRRCVKGLSEGELAWAPFDSVWGPMIAIHVAHCKVIYADQAFGSGKLQWGDLDGVLGAPGEQPDGERMVRILDRAQEFLVDHISRASDEDLERTYPMHHGVPHTGWQVACAMAQHDAWHGGQIALMRAAYRQLAEPRG